MRLALLASVLAALLAAPSDGESEEDAADRDGPVLHEYIPGEAEAKALVDFAAQAGPGRLPPGFRQDGELLEKPQDGITPRSSERTIRRDDPKTRRHPEARPDRETLHEGQLHYQAVFNPSVVPFKRVTSLDSVDSSFVLGIRKPNMVPVGITPFTGSPERTVFWGSVLLVGRRGERLPLPSVAPDMEVHGYQTVPAGVEVTFLVDGADNFAVALGRNGTVRLRFLVTASTRYFGHPVPEHVRLADVPARFRPRVPPGVRAVARRMHARLGLDPDASVATLLHRMVAHFRAFEEGPLAIRTGNTYEDLTVSQRGVCRHRSYAFVITALALGLPARFVSNEAHAFVEVWIPRTGWLRIDLGGAASELRVTGAENRTVHRPVEDPFPKPPAYGRNYSRLSGAVHGLTPAQRRGPQPATGHGATRRMGPASGSGGVDPSAGAGAGAQRVALGAVTLEVTGAVTTGLRGEPLTVSGRIAHGSSDAPLAARPVELLLQAPGSKDLVILGETVSSADGRFDLRTTVPLTATVGRYRVVAYSPADRTYQAAWSD